MTPDSSPGDLVLPPVRARFRALATAIVPETAELDAAGWADLEAIVENALSKRPPEIRKQLAVFIRLLDVLPRLRWLRPFRTLGAEKRVRFLQGIQSSKIFLFRRGFWGLRTMVYMGYYARPQAYADLGYDAHLRGWLRHPESSDAARDATLRSATTDTPGTPHAPRPAGEEAGSGGPDVSAEGGDA